MATEFMTSTANFDHSVVAFVKREVQQSLRAGLGYAAPGTVIPAKLLAGSNGTMRSFAYDDLPNTTTVGTPGQGPMSLEDGQADPTLEDFAAGYIEFTGTEQGRGISVSTNSMKRSPHPLLSIATEKVARDILVSLDFLLAKAYQASTNVLYAGAATNAAKTDVAAGDVVKGQLIRRAVANLRNHNVLPVYGSGSGGAGGLYHGVLSPNVQFDIQSDDDIGGWLDASRYASGLFGPDVLGTYAGVAWVPSSRANFYSGGGAAGIDVYGTTIIGKDAVFGGDLGDLEVHTTPPGGQSDPFFRKAIVTWRAMLGAVLNTLTYERSITIFSASNA